MEIRAGRPLIRNLEGRQKNENSIINYQTNFIQKS